MDQHEIPVFDRWDFGYYSKPLSTVSTVLAGLEFAVPVVINARDIRSGKERPYGILTDFIIYTEVYCFSSSLAIYGKALEVHPRPLAFTMNAPESERRKGDAGSSFFSAHTTSAFASAVFTGYTFQLKHPESPLVPWVWGSMLATATTVGALRVASGKHFPSDLIVGAAVGSLFGYGIPRLHLNHLAKEINKDRSKEQKRSQWRIDPEVFFTSTSETPTPGLCIRF